MIQRAFLVRRYVSSATGRSTPPRALLPTNTTPKTPTLPLPDRDIVFYPPPSLASKSDRIGLYPPADTTPPPPAWMLRVPMFRRFFEPEPHVGPEEHNQPLGVFGVLLYIGTMVMAFGLGSWYIYEKYFTDAQQLLMHAQKEKRILEAMAAIREERRQARVAQEQQQQQRSQEQQGQGQNAEMTTRSGAVA